MNVSWLTEDGFGRVNQRALFPDHAGIGNPRCSLRRAHRLSDVVSRSLIALLSAVACVLIASYQTETEAGNFLPSHTKPSHIRHATDHE